MSTLPRPDAVLLDVDGTLVDSNYLHVTAWYRAFLDVGATVPMWRIHRTIGMDSGALIGQLLGDDADRLGDDAKERHSHHYAGLGDLLRPLPGARDLVAALARDGREVVLATSAAPDELERLRDVLDVEVDLTAITAGADVDTAKPAPDLVGVALEKAGVDAGHALFVGDATWDVEAAARAGVTCVVVRSGGIGTAELAGAGALAVFDDPVALHAAVDPADREHWLRF